MKYDMLNEQIAYYRARAQEYDESVGGTEEAKGTFISALRVRFTNSMTALSFSRQEGDLAKFFSL
jgi:hypothetical protein